MERLSGRNLDLALSVNTSFGPGAASRTGGTAREAGSRRAFIVTDPGIVASGAVEPVLDSLRRADLPAEVFDGVAPNPSDGEVLGGSERLGEFGLAGTVVVAVGGGSALDAAKAISLHAANGGAVADLDYRYAPEKPGLPVIALPTTAGTGSETNSFGVITSGESGRKFYVGHASVGPRACLLDPELTTGLPSAATAATGIDALSHALEATMSVSANPYADALALGVARTVNAWLPVAVERGDDLEARSQMLLAAHLAGLAFASGTGLGLGHALAHPVGARLGAPHGAALAAVLPAVMEFNLPEKAHKLAPLAGALGAGGDLPEEVAAKEAIRRVEELIGRVLGDGLTKYTVSERDLDVLVRDTLDDGVISNTPRLPSESEVRKLLVSTLLEVGDRS
ncbi:Alcohol dehydrogenase class IV [Rubrobacter radiotolerans]|uniref:Alcohol dehydrogenase class IV n=1 Tax=Rubrobacter radiotolerans TaxID=42256 RepID=A0A023X552_RUBRA|nr:iron-containing alcohol dehydrogenase [Rubrobacter radiotolerans]AHY47356.1 Alcohol dehydrogenase class IV [Rubrobacter radiotolerans]SMC06706.1 alcohol dehydrogenase [Rubrobacter radiotolerans DSM 5868]